MQTLTKINANGNEVTMNLPKIVILTSTPWHQVALDGIFQRTGLHFKPCFGGLEAQPESKDQILNLLLMQNFKTNYHDNATFRNTLFLKSDHHVGFKIDSVCYDCCQHNHIHTGHMKPGDRLAC